MKNIFFRIMLLLALLMPMSSVVNAAQPGILLTDELLLRLGDAFSADGDYYRAVTEYKRLLILFPDSSRADIAMFKMGMAYYQGEEYESANKTFASISSRYPKSKFAGRAAYQQGLCLMKLGKPDKAAELFSAAAGTAPEKKGDERAAVFGVAMSSIDRNNLAAGRSALEQFVSNNPEDPAVPRAIAAIDLLDRNLNPPHKSALLAGTMSAILPGSGQFYAGRYGDAFTSLLLNGLFIAGTVVAAQNENYALAGVTGLIGLPFYIGNIYGGANAATKWNMGIRKDFRGKMALILEYPF